jgi:DNA-binding MarR family transcriptional regulator
VSTAKSPDASSSSDDTTQRIARALRELRRGASTAALRDRLIGPDARSIEQAQIDALEILAGSPGGYRMSEFADAMRVDPSTATRALDRLQRLGLAERTVDERDRRVVVAHATAVGERLVRSVVVRRSAGMERLLESFSPDEQAQLADFLDRLVESIDRLLIQLTEEPPDRRLR